MTARLMTRYAVVWVGVFVLSLKLELLNCTRKAPLAVFSHVMGNYCNVYTVS